VPGRVFAWCHDEFLFLASVADKGTFSSLASIAWLRVPSDLIRQFRIVVYNAAGSGAMEWLLKTMALLKVAERN
jgi:hypothetical protein